MTSDMRIYYHKFITCPDCHAPHNGGSLNKMTDGEENITYKCETCGAHFRESVDLLSGNNDSIGTINTLKTYGIEEPQKYLEKFPLTWKIKSNAIEKEYMNWIGRVQKGKFIITWPWERVKFLPLLIDTYLSGYPDSNIVVIYRKDEKPEKIINEPDFEQSFKSIIFTEEQIDQDNRSIMVIIKKLNFQHLVFLKKRICKVTYNRKYTPSKPDEINCDDTLIKCKNKLKREAKEDSIPIRKIKLMRLNNKNDGLEIIHEDGSVDIKIKEVEEWSGKLHYHTDWISEVLAYSKRMRRLKNSVPYEVITAKIELNEISNTKKLYMIPEETDTIDGHWYRIFEYINKIKPSLVIIEDTDYFMRYYNFSNSQESYRMIYTQPFLNFLKNTENSTVLMFSTDRDVRNLYGINYETENFLENYNIEAHTWDSDIVIERIKKKHSHDNEWYPGPVSSGIDELDYNNREPEIEYIPVDNLAELDKIQPIIKQYINGDPQNFSHYLYKLKSSPLMLIGDYSQPEVFSFTHNNDSVTYTILQNTLHDNMLDEEEEFQSIVTIFNKIYHNQAGEKINPLMDMINQKVDELSREKKAFITVITDAYSVKGTEKLLNKNGTHVCTWIGLSAREEGIPDRSKHYVIALIAPYAQYSIHSGHVDKFIFIASESNIEHIKLMIDNRLSIRGSKPFFKPTDTGQYPDLLKRITGDLPPNDKIRNTINTLEINFEGINAGSTEKTKINNVSHHSLLKKGEKAFRIENANHESMLIPFNAVLTVRKDNTPDIIDCKNILKYNFTETFKNVGIFMNNTGIYTSLKTIFIKTILEYRDTEILNKIRFTRATEIWEGFYDLIKSANIWINAIKQMISICEKTDPAADCNKKISLCLSGLNLIAKNPEYIRGWWENYETIITDRGEYNIYNIEHPQSIEDVFKIYDWVIKTNKELEYTRDDFRRSYQAAITIQNIRKKLWDHIRKKNKSIIPLDGVYSKIADRMNDQLSRSPVFTVKEVFKVELNKDMEPFTVLAPESENDSYTTLP